MADIEAKVKKIISEQLGVPEADVKVGMEMKAAPNHLPNGQINYVFHKA